MTEQRLPRNDYAPDGSPVALYVRLSGEREAELIDAQLHAGSSILELGCGAGRLTHELILRGHRVTGVDNSTDMLAHVRGAETIEADIVGLDLARTFDAVLLWSHLINTADATVRHEFMATCRRHMTPGGRALVWRFEPGWVNTVEASRSEDDSGMISELHSVAHVGTGFVPRWRGSSTANATSSPSKQSTSTDATLEELACRQGMTVAGFFEPHRMLVRLEVAR